MKKDLKYEEIEYNKNNENYKPNFEINDYYNYANKYGGKYLNKKVMYLENDKNNFRFKCIRNHMFLLTFQEIKNNKWCKNCEKQYNILEKLIIKKKGTIIKNNPYINIYNIKCKYNHIFEINKWNLGEIREEWCNKCINSKHFHSDIKKQRQNELLTVINNKISWYIKSSSINNFKDKIKLEIYKAKNFVNGNFFRKLGIDLIKHNNADILSEINSLGIYNIQKILLNYFINLNTSLVKKFIKYYNVMWRKRLFKLCCLLLHPDKNSFEFSKEAFVKLLYCFK